MPSKDGYKTIQDVAKIFNVSEMTVRRWIAADKLKKIQIMGTIRIADSEIDRVKKGDLK